MFKKTKIPHSVNKKIFEKNLPISNDWCCNLLPLPGDCISLQGQFLNQYQIAYLAMFQ